MSDDTFSKVEKSSKTMYGPRGILVCGYSKEEQTAFFSILKEMQMEEISVRFPLDADDFKSLKTLLEETEPAQADRSSLRRAVIMSGLTQEELHKLIASHRESGLPKPLWASLTPISESWALKDLLETLAKEHAAMKQR
ncbi:MAG: DUF3783 domain-containing protein [Deltaproteobacteria bacterium]|nr:DUF3783 domain-containing protein [Deltaproteobacteria bacterium]